ncbi:hypothetical protein TNCV_2530621 [Trichonephila clavipes]|nr:hypothetical protein TNCV_2530621 [Trichonephila clavipes]
MIVTTTEIESGFVAKDGMVPFRCSSVSSCAAPLQTEVSMGGRQGQHTMTPQLGLPSIQKNLFEGVCDTIFDAEIEAVRQVICHLTNLSTSDTRAVFLVDS